MGKPRTPNEILEAKGAFSKNPQRRRTAPKSNLPIGDPPEHLTPRELPIWAEFIGAIPTEILVETDRFALARLCQLECKARTDPHRMPGVESGQLLKLYGMFGLSPSDRTRLHVLPQPDADDPYSKF